MLGSVNAVYFATNTFIPYYLHATGRGRPSQPRIDRAQCRSVAGIVRAAGGRRSSSSAGSGPTSSCGLVCACVPSPALRSATALVVVASAAVLGFAAAAVLILMLALPPLLSPPDDVHRTAAAMFTISYTCAVVTPIISGLAWDLTGIPALAFIPIGLMRVPAGRVCAHDPRSERYWNSRQFRRAPRPSRPIALLLPAIFTRGRRPPNPVSDSRWTT